MATPTSRQIALLALAAVGAAFLLLLLLAGWPSGPELAGLPPDAIIGVHR